MMVRAAGRSLFLCIAMIANASTLIAGERVIYGEDDRKEIFDPRNDEMLVETAKSTAILIKSSELGSSTQDRFSVPTETLKETGGVCADEPFADQINPGFCSGFLVGPDLMATAGHCITSQSACNGISFVFDFGYDVEEKDLSSVPKANVFKCKSIVKQVLDGGSAGKDFAIVRIDRPVVDRTPLKVRRTGDAQQGDQIAVIGHPSGLPTKISDEAVVRTNNSSAPFFVANLDTYGGNSGSAVVSMVTGEVEGILVRGETDFVYDNARGCYKSKICTTTGCRGEDVSKASTFAGFIP
jgi:V8-like Glu-specific endopeptidase